MQAASVSLIPRLINPASFRPASPQHTSENRAACRSAQMRYTPVGTGQRGSPFRGASQPVVQSCYSSKGQSPVKSLRSALALAKLEDLLQWIDCYNHDGSDLGRFGSALRIPERRIELRLKPEELLKLPFELRDARRSVVNAITELVNREKTREETHPIEHNFNAIKALLGRLEDLQPSLPKLANKSETKNSIGRNPIARNAELRLSMLSPSSINSLDSCDLPSDLANSSAGSSPSCELFPPPLHSAMHPTTERTASTSGPRPSSGKSRISKYHQERVARITQFNRNLQKPYSARSIIKPQ